MTVTDTGVGFANRSRTGQRAERHLHGAGRDIISGEVFAFVHEEDVPASRGPIGQLRLRGVSSDPFVSGDWGGDEAVSPIFGKGRESCGSL